MDSGNSCVGCGYRLVDAAPEGACPECGVSAGASRRTWQSLGGEAVALERFAGACARLAPLWLFSAILLAMGGIQAMGGMVRPPWDIIFLGLVAPLAAANFLGAVELIRIGTRPPMQPVATRRRRWLIAGVAVAWSMVGILWFAWALGPALRDDILRVLGATGSFGLAAIMHSLIMLPMMPAAAGLALRPPRELPLWRRRHSALFRASITVLAVGALSITAVWPALALIVPAAPAPGVTSVARSVVSSTPWIMAAAALANGVLALRLMRSARLAPVLADRSATPSAAAALRRAIGLGLATGTAHWIGTAGALSGFRGAGLAESLMDLVGGGFPASRAAMISVFVGCGTIMALASLAPLITPRRATRRDGP